MVFVLLDLSELKEIESFHALANVKEVMMKIAVIGGTGLIGSKLVNNLRANGHEAVAKLLVENYKVNPNSEDNDGRTPLSWAAGNGHKDVAKMLIETGKVEVDSTDYNSWTPLSWAAEEGHEAVVKLLQSSIATQFVAT